MSDEKGKKGSVKELFPGSQYETQPEMLEVKKNKILQTSENWVNLSDRELHHFLWHQNKFIQERFKSLFCSVELSQVS